MKSPFAAAVVSALLLAPVASLAAGGPTRFFAQADANGDGTLSKDEAAAFRKAEVAKMDGNKDGYVSADEMKDFVLAKMEARAADMADKRIKAADKDSDGRLSIAELEGDDRMTRLFARLDKDGDGAITRAEMETWRARWMHHRGGCDMGPDGAMQGGKGPGDE